MTNPRTYDVIVVGGGIIGAASAYYLAKAGRSVLLCERDDLAAQASGQNLGYISLQALHGNPPRSTRELISRSLEILRTLESDLDWDFNLRRTGGLHYFLDGQKELYEGLLGRLRSRGVHADLIEGAELRRLAPALSQSIPGGILLHDEAHDRGQKLVRGFVRAAERLGAVVKRGTDVRELSVHAGRVHGVVTREGTESAEHVVVAAGIWSTDLCRQSGIDVPIEYIRTQVVATEPMPFGLRPVLMGPGSIVSTVWDKTGDGGINELPGYAEAIAVDDPRMGLTEYACQTRDGRYLLGCPVGPANDPRMTADLDGLRRVAIATALTLPSLASVGIERTWAGLLPRTADGLPIIDSLADPSGLILAAGSQNGNTTGSAVGELVACLVAGEPVPDWLAECRLDRPGLLA